jgi:uncharacterized membrane protein YccF (DUF307 family)
MVQVGANYFGRSRVVQGMTGRIETLGTLGVGARVEQLAWMTLAGGWLAAFTLTAGVANFVRPYCTARAGDAAAPRDDRYRSAPSS